MIGFTVDMPPPGSPTGSVALTGGDAEARLAHETRAWWPWQVSNSGCLLVHVSSLVFLSRAGFVRGFTKPARAYWDAYAAECKRSYGDAKVTPDGAFDWKTVLSDEWKPRRYQEAGMDRLYARCVMLGRGCLLGDSVGLGKTGMFIGFAERHRQATGEPVVVVTTLSTVTQWADEVKRFARLKPSVVAVIGPASQRAARLRAGGDWTIVSYETVRMSGDVGRAVAELPVGAMAIDESYRIANPSTQTHKTVVALAARAAAVVPFNATPIENSLEDVFGQLRAVDRSVLGSRSDFRGRYVSVDYMGRAVGARNVREFRLRTAAVCLRRTVDDCGEEMPAVIAQVRRCEMGPKQSDAYRERVAEFVADTSTGAVAMAKIAAARYAAFAVDVANFKSESCKMDDLEELLRTELAGQRVVVMSKFRRVIEFAARRLAASRPYVIHGGTPDADRTDIRRKFESSLGEGKVLLGTEAIERGLNLQTAGVLYNLDLPWTASRLRQRAGRIARIGQTRKKVLVLNCCSVYPSGKATVDEWLVQTVARKREVFDRVYGPDETDELGDDNIDVGALRGYLKANG